jgi:hypothetical protein
VERCAATFHENKTYPDSWVFFAPFSTWFDSKILYTLDENAVPNRGQRLYANSATAVDQICRFQGKIRIKVDKIA